MQKEESKEQSKNLPKVLIFEHPPLYKEGIGKTLYSFFYYWPKDKLAQVYSVNLPIDETLCQYYYASDINKTTNETVESKKQREKNGNSQLFHILAQFIHSEIGVQVRNLIYHVNSQNKGINKWIDTFNPDCIFYGIGEILYENDFILEMAKKRGIPLILYVSDDYMTKWKNITRFRGYGKKIVESYANAMSYSSLVVVISEKMRELYQRQFPDCKYLVASNSSICKRNLKNLHNRSANIIRFSYSGNLGLGRWKMLKVFAAEIEHYNDSNKNNVRLELAIYSQEKPSSVVMSHITNQYSFYMGNVTGDELDKERMNSDVLLLVESFDEQYKNILSNALSTKVPEYLSYGMPIFAWAPNYAWSLGYLYQNNAAYCVSEKDIEKGIEDFVIQFRNNDFIDIISNANNLFDKKHEFMENAKKFASAICNTVHKS